MADEINQLMRRCYDACRRARKRNTGYTSRFKIEVVGTNPWLWQAHVRTQAADYLETGSTVAVTLRKWLKEHEHRWD